MPRNPLLRPGLALPVLLLLASCATPPPAPTVAMPPPPPPPPPVMEVQQGRSHLLSPDLLHQTLYKIGASSEIALVRVEHRGGYTHRVITEMWRSDPSASPPWHVGSEPFMPRPTRDGDEKYPVSIIYHITSNTGHPATVTTPVDVLLAETSGAELQRLRDYVLSIPPAAPPPAAPVAGRHPMSSEDERIRESGGIYLLDLDRSGGEVHGKLVRIFRHRPSLGPAPALGSDLLEGRWRSSAERMPGNQMILLVPEGPGRFGGGTISVVDGVVLGRQESIGSFAAYIRRLDAP